MIAPTRKNAARHYTTPPQPTPRVASCFRKGRRVARSDCINTQDKERFCTPPTPPDPTPPHVLQVPWKSQRGKEQNVITLRPPHPAPPKRGTPPRVCKNKKTNLSTTKMQNAKRTFRNACSERRGVFSGFMDPGSLRILFLLPAKRIHSITWPAQFYLNQAKKGSVFGLPSAF